MGGIGCGAEKKHGDAPSGNEAIVGCVFRKYVRLGVTRDLGSLCPGLHIVNFTMALQYCREKDIKHKFLIPQKVAYNAEGGCR